MLYAKENYYQQMYLKQQIQAQYQEFQDFSSFQSQEIGGSGEMAHTGIQDKKLQA